jgi:hypothetical protein
MGRLGKTSLAARLASRRRDLTLVVVYRDYDALSVLDCAAKRHTTSTTYGRRA